MKEGHQGFSFFYALQKVRHKYLYVYDEKNVAYDENFQDPFRQVAKIFKSWRDLCQSFYAPTLHDLGRMQNDTLLLLLLTQPFLAFLTTGIFSPSIFCVFLFQVTPKTYTRGCL